VASICWLTVVESDVDTWQFSGQWLGATWPNHGLPRGTPKLVGCMFVKCNGVRGVRPPDLPTAQTLTQTPITNRATAHTLIYICFGLNLKSLVGIVGPRPGRA
jgi:hypothetical protein